MAMYRTLKISPLNEQIWKSAEHWPITKEDIREIC
jgi:hypothetical protein